MLLLNPLEGEWLKITQVAQAFWKLWKEKSEDIMLAFEIEPEMKGFFHSFFFSFKVFNKDNMSGWVGDCSAFAVGTPVVPGESNYGWEVR